MHIITIICNNPWSTWISNDQSCAFIVHALQELSQRIDQGLPLSNYVRATNSAFKTGFSMDQVEASAELHGLQTPELAWEWCGVRQAEKSIGCDSS